MNFLLKYFSPRDLVLGMMLFASIGRAYGLFWGIVAVVLFVLHLSITIREAWALGYKIAVENFTQKYFEGE